MLRHAMPAFSIAHSVPNLITLARLALVPMIVTLILAEDWTGAFAAFAIAGASDAVDGFIAKRFDLRTELGAYLDPIADKALLVSIYVSLAIAGVLPSALAVLVVSRDLMIVGAVLVAMLLHRPMEIRPLFVSKANTAAQIALAGLVLAAKAFDWGLEPWMMGLVWIVAILTLASVAAYLARWLQHMSG